MILKEHLDRQLTARELFSLINKRWSRHGIKSPIALGHILMRFNFDKEKMKYLISEKKIDEYIEKENKRKKLFKE